MARIGRPPKPLDKHEVQRVFKECGNRLTPVIKHFGVRGNRIVPLLPKGAYTPPPKPSPRRRYVRNVKYRTPRSIRRLDAWLRNNKKTLQDITLDEAFGIMRKPTAKGAQVLARLSGPAGAEIISYPQAAELLGCGSTYLHHINKRLKAGSQTAALLPMHPRFRNRIDARQLMEQKAGIYPLYCRTLTHAEASELFMRAKRITPSGANHALKALGIPRVKMHLAGGGYDFQSFKAALVSRAARRIAPDYARQVLLSWSRDPDNLKVPPTRRSIKPVLQMLDQGIFSMPNSRLLRGSSANLIAHRRALVSDPRYAPVNGHMRTLPLRQNAAALRAFGIDPATSINGTTLAHVMSNADRIYLGKTASGLMQAGRLPKHLPNAAGRERAAADAALLNALNFTSTGTEGIQTIRSVLEARAPADAQA